MCMCLLQLLFRSSLWLYHMKSSLILRWLCIRIRSLNLVNLFCVTQEIISVIQSTVQFRCLHSIAQRRYYPIEMYTNHILWLIKNIQN